MRQTALTLSTHTRRCEPSKTAECGSHSQDGRVSTSATWYLVEHTYAQRCKSQSSAHPCTACMLVVQSFSWSGNVYSSLKKTNDTAANTYKLMNPEKRVVARSQKLCFQECIGR